MNAPRRATGALAAFVLHHHDWSESSLILELFTRERGRLAVAAKGAKRPHSQWRPVLLPFQMLLVQLGRSAGDDSAEVHNLRSVEWAGGAPMPTGGALFSGYYLNELLLKMLARQDPHPALFDAYGHSLSALAAADERQSQAALRAFELRLLHDSGLLPDLACLTQTAQPLLPTAAYTLAPEAGLAAAQGDEAALSGAAWLALQAALLHGSQAALQAACAEAVQPLRTQLRRLLHYHLGTPVLRTRQVLADVQKLMEAPPR